MTKDLKNIIAISNIIISLVIYYMVFQTIEDSHPSVKGWVQFFVLLCSLVQLVNGLSLYTLIDSTITKSVKVLILVVYCILVITPIVISAVENEYFNILILPLTLSVGVILTSLIVLKGSKIKHFLALNSVIFVLNLIWAVLMIKAI